MFVLSLDRALACDALRLSQALRGRKEELRGAAVSECAECDRLRGCQAWRIISEQACYRALACEALKPSQASGARETFSFSSKIKEPAGIPSRQELLVDEFVLLT